MKQFFKCIYHKGNNIISLSLFIILLLISGQTNAQDAILSGGNHAWTGEKRIYTVSNYDEIMSNLNGIEGFYWDAFSGPNGWLKKVENDVNGNPIIVDVGQNIDFYQWWDGDGVPLFDMDRVAVEWAQSGSNHVTYLIYDDWEDYYGELSVVVEDLQAPNNPTVSSSSCGQSTLTRVGIPPLADVTWYWQGKDANGTATDKGSGSSFIANEGSGTYYIRARSDNGIWSSASGSVYVSINESTTWYLDQDDDGLGDPNISLSACSQPIGYVNNSSDSCNLSDRNFIYTITPTTETTDVNILANNSKIENITYFDGLGRPMQNIGIQAGGGNEDIVTHIEYDAFGRQVQEYLPYASATNCGIYRTDALTSTNSFYNTLKYENTANPYSKKEFDASPLNRVLKQAAPGNDWKLGDGHEIKLDYETNTASEVKNYGVTLSFANNTYTPTLILSTVNSGFYNTGELYKTITKDENWISSQAYLKDHTTEEFKDKQGHVILKRTYDHNNEHDTYYVYDDYGNLSYVLPPKMDAFTTSISTINSQLNDLGYQYKYDYRDRLVEKRLPGKQWEFIVYDKLDRPVLTQDANLRASNKWLFTKYDAFSRPVYTGDYLNAVQTSRTDVQGLVDASATLFETKTSSNTINGTTVYYSNSAFPSTDINLFTINYYDNYTFDLDGGSSALSYGVTPITNTKGLATGTKVRVLGTTNWITNVIYYDAKARPIYNYSKNNYLGTKSTVKSQLDFVGKVQETTSTHERNNVTTTVVDAFTYDQAGRLTKQAQVINGATTPEVIVENNYDALGQLYQKKVGGKTTQSRLQTVDFTYNVRGWLKGINDGDTSNSNITLGSGDLFGFQINYNDGPTDPLKKLYNGNISQTYWKTANTDNSLKNYNYSYDALNRLTLAESQDSGRYNENLNYDKNGNIISLLRLGNTILNTQNFGTIDNLGYVYDAGNKLIKVEDSSGNGEGFNNGSSGSNTDYTYDTNGNMLTDANKNITTISYNHLNLPTQITFAAGNIQYFYDATGVKQRKIVSTGATTDYAAGYIYENNNLKFFSQPEGYVSYNSGAFDYIYQYKDHLGNVRLSYDKNLAIVEENNYYPFGLKQNGYNNTPNYSNGSPQAEKYKYNGKELQDELGLNMYDYGARNYDPALGRWMNIDPLAEKYFHASTYAYVCNDPINFIDPDGMDRYYMNSVGKTVLALKENKEDMLFIADMNNKNIIDINKDGKQDSNDGLKVKSKGLLSQLTNYRAGSEKSGTKYFSSIGEQSKQHEEDYLNIFKFASDNTSGAEFSLTFYEDRGKEWIEFATYQTEKRSPSPDGLGTGINYSKVRWHAHNHPSGYTSEMRSMGYINENEMYKPSDARNAVVKKRNYPNYVYFPESKNLYNVSMYGIKYIKKINNSKDLK